MRYIIKYKAKPTMGAKRMKDKFLWLPKKINKEIRWLERAKWIERYSGSVGLPSRRFKWEAWEWVDDLKKLYEL